MSRDRDEVFRPALVPRGSSGAMLRDWMQVAGVAVPRIAVRGGLAYQGSSFLLRSLGVPSGYATPLAMAFTALDIAYVE